MLKKYRDAATDLHVCHGEVIILNDKLGLSIVRNISIVIDSSGEKPCSSLLNRSPRNKHKLKFNTVGKDGFKQINIPLNDWSAPFCKQLLLKSITVVFSLIGAIKCTHVLTLDVDFHNFRV